MSTAATARTELVELGTAVTREVFVATLLELKRTDPRRYRLLVRAMRAVVGRSGPRARQRLLADVRRELPAELAVWAALVGSRGAS